ncbi:phage tail tape measure protein [Campylobacter pinnipediorum]|uniref:phage tail tape measure protein n=1 Tax=Campylobacter pinnipediorum TaxID=1965231 RepID=UPI000994B33D|nr:phage tail tape measure protein [Campylobacter pinnipediorum]AQW82895.1 putative phage tail protein [Campylobacter pinnipediorum subsp. pinnipediorum]
MAKPILTFGMDLSDFNKAMSVVNRETRSFSNQLNKVTKDAMTAYKKGLQELKANPLADQKVKEKLDKLKQDLIKATSTKIRLNIDEATKKIMNLKGEALAAFASISAVKAPIKTAIDFESAMADVKKVVDFDTPEEVKLFLNKLLKMSQIIPMTAEGLSQVTAAGAQMGIAKDELFKFTELASKTAVAFDITAEQAGDSIGKIKNIPSLSIDETGEMMDAINHISNKNAAKASEIVEVMKRISGIGKQVGISKEQTAALATSFIALGKAPETAATASEALLKKLNNIKSATPKAQKAFSDMGIDINDFSNAMKKDAQGTILKFLSALQKVEPQKRGTLLTSIMGLNYDSDIATLISGIDI